jgi:hypothetical protein
MDELQIQAFLCDAVVMRIFNQSTTGIRVSDLQTDYVKQQRVKMHKRGQHNKAIWDFQALGMLESVNG